LTLEEDVRHMDDVDPGTRFDAVICLGNSLSALPDFEGGLSKHRRALSNFWALVRPGGLLVIDHRNYDSILDTGVFPSSNIYYDVRRLILLHARTLINGQTPHWFTLQAGSWVKKLERKEEVATSQQRPANFATEKIVDAQNFRFAARFPPNWKISAPFRRAKI